MSNTANTSLAQIKKAEEDTTKMIAQAQKTRDEKIAKKQADLQKEYNEAEEVARDNANNNLSVYKNEVSGKGKQIMHDAKRETSELKNSLEAKIDQAAEAGVNILKTSLGLSWNRNAP